MTALTASQRAAFARGLAEAERQYAEGIEAARVRLAHLESLPEHKLVSHGTKPDGKRFVTSDFPGIGRLRHQIAEYDARQRAERGAA